MFPVCFDNSVNFPTSTRNTDFTSAIYKVSTINVAIVYTNSSVLSQTGTPGPRSGGVYPRHGVVMFGTKVTTGGYETLPYNTMQMGSNVVAGFIPAMGWWCLAIRLQREGVKPSPTIQCKRIVT